MDRRTNAERSAATRAKLLDATVALLAEVGYARTSTTEISRRAGVSRGAQLHHFPSKVDLVAAAVDHVVERRVEELRAIVTTLPVGDDRFDMAIDVLWSIAQGPSFEAWFELVLASRTDVELRPIMAELADRLGATVREVWSELFPPPAGANIDSPVYATAPLLFFAVLDGLAVQLMAGGSQVRDDAERVLGLVKVLARLIPLGTEPDAVALLDSLMRHDGDARPNDARPNASADAAAASSTRQVALQSTSSHAPHIASSIAHARHAQEQS